MTHRASILDRALGLVPRVNAPHGVAFHDQAFVGLHIPVLDLRGLDRNSHYDPRDWGYFSDGDPTRNIPSRGRAHGILPWRKRTAIMLHITAVHMSAKRFLGCPCHIGIADDATVVLCHPLDAYVWHGHAANRFAVGIEISSPDGAITDLQNFVAREVVRYCVDERQSHVVGPMVIMPHAFSHRSRTNDPGREVWEGVGQWAIDELGLGLGPIVGTGTRPTWT